MGFKRIPMDSVGFRQLSGGAWCRRIPLDPWICHPLAQETPQSQGQPARTGRETSTRERKFVDANERVKLSDFPDYEAPDATPFQDIFAWADDVVQVFKHLDTEAVRKLTDAKKIQVIRSKNKKQAIQILNAEEHAGTHLVDRNGMPRDLTVMGSHVTIVSDNTNEPDIEPHGFLEWLCEIMVPEGYHYGVRGELDDYIRRCKGAAERGRMIADPATIIRTILRYVARLGKNAPSTIKMEDSEIIRNVMQSLTPQLRKDVIRAHGVSPTLKQIRLTAHQSYMQELGAAGIVGRGPVSSTRAVFHRLQSQESDERQDEDGSELDEPALNRLVDSLASRLESRLTRLSHTSGRSQPADEDDDSGGEFSEEVLCSLCEEPEKDFLHSVVTHNQRLSERSNDPRIKRASRAGVCWYCGKPGHFQSDCHKRKEDLKNNQGTLHALYRRNAGRGNRRRMPPQRRNNRNRNNGDFPPRYKYFRRMNSGRARFTELDAQGCQDVDELDAPDDELIYCLPADLDPSEDEPFCFA